MYSVGALSVSIAVALLLVAQSPAPAAAEACRTCHAGAAIERPHRALTSTHRAFACTSCHRGVATATTAAGAHAAGSAEALLAGPATAAGCASCHVIGAKGTELLVRGVDVYLEQGCALCHQALGLGPADAIGRPLDAIGQRDPAFLRALLERPSRFYPGTPMPPYAGLLHHGPQGEALIAYLRTMRGQPRVGAGPVAVQSCATCHASTAGAKTTAPSDAALTRHACVRIRAEAAELSCKRCHGAQVPAGPRECLYVEARRAECAACHEVKR